MPCLLEFLDLLEKWNRTHNVTAIRDRGEALEKHLLDSLTPLPLLPVGASLLDFGSGAGLPGLVLKLYRPDLRLSSLEPVGKKAVFQRQVVRHYQLDRTDIHTCRLESFAARKKRNQGFDRVVFRAVGPPERYAEAACQLLADRGLLLAMKGPGADWAWDKSLAQGRLRPLKKIGFTLPYSGSERSLLVWEKL
ncbi:MAG: 16S rRNA (guanine(527)-N(7))-methyltransferase RsmG [Deltaproteobacteria bacterium]|nr:MAG: 16S rRNA (guanine(527)-N(7))-methyltransferase RsmG [Deltaproteobacteria bacterium]